MTSEKLSRRTLTGLAAAGVSAPLLAACGSDDSGSARDTTSSGSASASQSPSAASSSAAPSEPASSAAPAGEGLASTSEIEVGGGRIFADEEVVVTQPTEGDFKAFSSICTHQGCPVTSISDGAINCECHGSRFDIATGEVLEGPATAALAAEPVTVTGDQISLG